MNTPPVSAAAPRRRRVWPWVLLAVLVAPFAVLGVAAYSYLSLDREAAALRKQVFSATAEGWNTKVQMSVGGFTLGSIRTGLAFVDHGEVAEARQALAAVRAASVGVYERAAGARDWSREQLIAGTDLAMGARGWMRMVGVVENEQTVLVYVPEGEDEPVRVCVAVVGARELVVVSATLEAEALAKLMRESAGGRMNLGGMRRLGKI